MKLWMWALLGLGGLWVISQMNKSQSFLPGFSPGQATGNGVGVSGTLSFGNGWTGSATLGNSSPISTGGPGSDLTTTTSPCRTDGMIGCYMGG